MLLGSGSQHWSGGLRSQAGGHPALLYFSLAFSLSDQSGLYSGALRGSLQPCCIRYCSSFQTLFSLSQTLYWGVGVSTSQHCLLVNKRICVLSSFPKGLTPLRNSVIFLPQGTWEVFSPCFYVFCHFDKSWLDSELSKRIHIISLLQRKIYDPCTCHTCYLLLVYCPSNQAERQFRRRNILSPEVDLWEARGRKDKQWKK